MNRTTLRRKLNKLVKLGEVILYNRSIVNDPEWHPMQVMEAERNLTAAKKEVTKIITELSEGK